MAYLDILQQLADAGVLGPTAEGEKVTDPPAPVPELPPAPAKPDLPTDFPAGMRDADLQAAQRADHASRLALGGANALLASSGVPGGGFAPSHEADDILARRDAVLKGQKLQEGAIDLAGKKAAFEQSQATRQAMQDPAVIGAQRQEIAWDMAASRKGGQMPTPEEVNASMAVVASVPALALPQMADQAMARNKERAATNKEFANAYAATRSAEKTKAETAEIPANDAAKRAQEYAVAAWHRAQAAGAGAGPKGVEDVKSIADGVMDGTLPPDLKRINPKVATPVQAELQRRGFNLSRASTIWNATQQHVKTMNGSRIATWRMAIDNVNEQINTVEEAYQRWEKAGGPGKYRVINAASLKAAKESGDGELAQSAAYLEGTMTALVDKAAKAIMGGGTPTDESMKLAQKLIGQDLPPNQFRQKLNAIRADVAAGRNALLNAGPAGIGGNDQYMPDQTPPKPEAPAAQPSAAKVPTVVERRKTADGRVLEKLSDGTIRRVQ